MVGCNVNIIPFRSVPKGFLKYYLESSKLKVTIVKFTLGSVIS